MSEPIQFTISLDLDKSLMGKTHYSADDEGEPYAEPTTLADVVIEAAAQMLFREVTGPNSVWMTREVGDYNRRQTQLAKVISEEVNSKLTREFQDAIAKGKAQIKSVFEAEAAKVLAETLIRQAKGA